MQTWEPSPSKNPLPSLPSELRERPGIQWLYLCRMAGLSMSDLAHMRIDTAEALIELHDFVQDHLIHGDEDGKRQSDEEAFWSL